jgi:DNA-binding MarR family transcriptional regulator
MADAEYAGDERLIRALLDTQRFSEAITKVAEDAVGSGLSGNALLGVLVASAQLPGASPSAVAERVGRRRSAVSRDLARLADADLVRLRRDVFDGRRSNIIVTPRGRQRIERFELQLADCFEQHRSGLRQICRDLGRPPVPVTGPIAPLEAAGVMAAAGAQYLEDLAERVPALRDRIGGSHFVLTLLYRSGSLFPSALADELKVSRARITGVLNDLDEQGLILRRPDSADRRRSAVRLSAKGRRTVHAMLEVFRDHAQELARALGHAEAAQASSAGNRRSIS